MPSVPQTGPTRRQAAAHTHLARPPRTTQRRPDPHDTPAHDSAHAVQGTPPESALKKNISPLSRSRGLQAAGERAAPAQHSARPTRNATTELHRPPRSIPDQQIPAVEGRASTSTISGSKGSRMLPLASHAGACGALRSTPARAALCRRAARSARQARARTPTRHTSCNK